MSRAAFTFLVCALALAYPILAQSDPQVAPSNATAAATPAAWQIAIQQRRQELIQKNGPGTDVALHDQLVQMGGADEAARGITHGSAASKREPETMEQLRASDAKRTAELKQIVSQKGWPTIALVGISGSNAAMLVLTHTADHAWQRELLPQLQQLADDGKIDAAPFAMMMDHELVAEGKLQKYGSQFMAIGGKISMYAVEDPAHLDDRRAAAMLSPIGVYKQQMSRMYHLEVSEDVVMAPAPAKK